TAVDSHRRLILIRRDDVEHLILIGGPTDVVVEQNIRLLPASRRPVGTETEDAPLHPAPRTPQPPVVRTPPVAPVAQPVRPPQTPSSPDPVSAPPPAPVSVAPVAMPPRPQASATPVEPHFTSRLSSPEPQRHVPQVAPSLVGTVQPP